MLSLKQNKKQIVFIVLLIFAVLPAIFWLFSPGFFVTDDGEWMIIRFSAFYETIRDGQIPPRFLERLNFGYGYPVANFLYPGFMYLGVPFHIIGFGYQDSIKIILLISILGSAIFTYLWLGKLFNKWSAFIGSVAYVYFPYHLFDLYVRGSVGELLALAVVPFILWSIERYSLFWGSIGIAFLILSHNTLALLFLPIIFMYLAIKINSSKDKKIILARFGGLFELGLGLSAFFWIPALFDLRYTVFSSTQVSTYQNYFTTVNLIGISTFLIGLISIVALIIVKKRKPQQIEEGVNRQFNYAVFFLFIGCVGLFFSSEFSSYAWSLLPIQFIQFPFRLLSIVLVCTAFLVSFSVQVFHKKIKYIVGVLFVCIIVFSAIPFIKPQETIQKGDDFYSTNLDTTTVKNEYLPPWVLIKPQTWPENKVTSENSQINSVLYNSRKIEFINVSSQSALVSIHTIYFPGWNATVNGENQEIIYNNPYGIVQLELPRGTSKVKLEFTETPVRLIADVISIVSLFTLCYIVIKKRRTSYEE